MSPSRPEADKVGEEGGVDSRERTEMVAEESDRHRDEVERPSWRRRLLAVDSRRSSSVSESESLSESWPSSGQM